MSRPASSRNSARVPPTSHRSRSAPQAGFLVPIDWQVCNSCHRITDEWVVLMYIAGSRRRGCVWQRCTVYLCEGALQHGQSTARRWLLPILWVPVTNGHNTATRVASSGSRSRRSPVCVGIGAGTAKGSGTCCNWVTRWSSYRTRATSWPDTRTM